MFTDKFIDCDVDDHYVIGSFISLTDLHSIHNMHSTNALTLSIDYMKKMLAHDKYDDVRYILECDKDTKIYINMMDNDGDSLLHMSIYIDKYSFAELLLECHANPNKLDKKKQSPIFRTIFTNNPSFIKLLKRYGADLNLTDEDGNSVLHLAVLMGNTVIIEELLKNNIDAHLKNNAGLFAMDYAKSFDSTVQCSIIKLFSTYLS